MLRLGLAPLGDWEESFMSELGFRPDQTQKLGAPLHVSAIRSRSQSGVNLSYIESHHAIREANAIFGFDGWHRDTILMDVVQEELKPNAKGVEQWYVTYRSKVRIQAGGVIREGTGFGHGFGKDKGDAHESAGKEAESDAMKRALMTFGDPFGLALYDKQQIHVDREPKAREANVTTDLPATASRTEKERNAQLYLRRTLNLGPEDSKAFKAFCGEDWADVAIDAEKAGMGGFTTLMRFAGGEVQESTEEGVTHVIE